MKLFRVQLWFDKLWRYLRAKRRGVPVVYVSHSRICDARHKKNKRAFAHVECGTSIVHVAKALEDQDDAVIVGVLLHEIGHIVIGCGNVPDDEVAVDEWIAEKVPEAGYSYEEVGLASNVEVVSDKFVKKLERI